MTVKKGDQVSFEYSLKDDAGEEIESNVGAEPLVYVHGLGQIVAGLENAIEGMSAGETKQVVVSPEEGYGEINSQGYVEIAKDKVPPEAHQEGAQLQMRGQDGQVMHASVSEIKDEVIVVDFNHPLAGKTLHFDVKVLDVTEAEEEASE